MIMQIAIPRNYFYLSAAMVLFGVCSRIWAPRQLWKTIISALLPPECSCSAMAYLAVAALAKVFPCSSLEYYRFETCEFATYGCGHLDNTHCSAMDLIAITLVSALGRFLALN